MPFLTQPSTLVTIDLKKAKNKITLSHPHVQIILQNMFPFLWVIFETLQSIGELPDSEYFIVNAQEEAGK